MVTQQFSNFIKIPKLKATDHPLLKGAFYTHIFYIALLHLKILLFLKYRINLVTFGRISITHIFFLICLWELYFFLKQNLLTKKKAPFKELFATIFSLLAIFAFIDESYALFYALLFSFFYLIIARLSLLEKWFLALTLIASTFYIGLIILTLIPLIGSFLLGRKSSSS
jgi:hypothetical protein